MKKEFLGLSITILAAFFLVLLPAVPAAAQGTPVQPHVLNNPDVNLPIYFDVSPPLWELASQAGPPQPGLHLALPVRYPKEQLLQQLAQRAPVEDGALQTSFGPLVNATLGLNLLGVGKGFDGYSVPDAPTDVNLAVGDTQVVQWVNVSYAVFNKSTGAVIAGPIEGNTLWAGFGGVCQSDNSGDIIAQWDKIAHRWVLTQNAFQGTYMTCIAISQTPDATGSYYRFAFQQPGFPDYPKWGLMPDAYYQSQNNFGAGGGGFVGAYACAYERAKLLTGDSTAKQICFQAGTFDDSLLPGDLDTPNTLPPAGQQEVYLGSIDNGSTTNVYEYLFHVDFTTPANSTFTGDGGTIPITVAAFNLACGGNSACVPQKGSSDNLDTLGDRLMYRLAYDNFADHQAWLVSHSVTAGSSVGERWYEFHAAENSTTLSAYQQGTYAPDGNYRWMGSIAMDKSQNIALGYSLSGSNLYPSIEFTGRTPSDALGTMETEAQIVAGTGSQTDTSNRWGDYTSMAIDEADGCTFWYTNQFYMTTASFGWSTQLASIKFAGCSTTPDFSISASPPTQNVIQGGSVTYTVTVTPLNGYTGTVNLSVISGCPTGSTCTLSSTSTGPPNYPSSTLTVQTGAATPGGTYVVSIQGTDGTITHTAGVTVVVVVPDFKISSSPTATTVGRGKTATFTLTLSSVNTFSGSVTLTSTGCPPSSTCSFSPNPANVPSGGSVKSAFSVATSRKTPTGTYMITATGTSGALKHSVIVQLTVKAK